MVGHKNVRFSFIMGRFIYFFGENKYQWKPYISPQHAKPQDHIAAPDPAKKTGDDHKRKNNQHDSNECDKSIDAIDPLQRFQ
jgi:hypothetical protein